MARLFCGVTFFGVLWCGCLVFRFVGFLFCSGCGFVFVVFYLVCVLGVAWFGVRGLRLCVVWYFCAFV